MKCEERRKYFDDYILGELDPTIEIQINEHVLVCKDCQKEIEDREKTIVLFKGLRRFAPSNRVYKRIRNKIYVPRKEKNLLWGLPRSLIHMAAAFLFGLVLMRSIDFIFLETKESPKIETKQEHMRKSPFSDTVQFYSAPAEHLVRI
jgi:hypothetical protein